MPNLESAQLPWQVAIALRDCLCAKLTETVAGPVCRCSLMAGEISVADICEVSDFDGSEGQAWVRLRRFFRSREFPRPDTDVFNCAPGLPAAEYELGVLRCDVTASDDGDPPSADDLNAVAEKVYDDMAALVFVGECCLPSSLTVLVSDWTPLSSGGCTGGIVVVTVQLSPGPHEISVSP